MASVIKTFFVRGGIIGANPIAAGSVCNVQQTEGETGYDAAKKAFFEEAESLALATGSLSVAATVKRAGLIATDGVANLTLSEKEKPVITPKPVVSRADTIIVENIIY